MEPEFNSENWQQPSESQSQPSPSYQYQPGNQSQSFLQQKWLNIKVSTWIQCLIIATVLSFVAVFVAPKFTKAKSKPQQETYEYYTEEDYWNDYYDCGKFGYND